MLQKKKRLKKILNKITEENLSAGESAEMAGITFTPDSANYTDERTEFAEVEVDSVVVLDVTYENNNGEEYVSGLNLRVYPDGSLAET